MKRVLILGATGLVGGELLKLLLAESWVSKVIVIVRRPTGHQHTKLDERLFDLSEMERHADVFAVDQIFCALGTTIKKAGTQERFRVVDHDYPVVAGKLGIANGAHHYLLVSALGASSSSRVFYNRVKGETENDLRALGYRSLTIARPSLLLGERQEFRLGEEIAKRVGWMTPRAYRPIEARDVARALVESARRDEPGVHVFESADMQPKSS